MRLLRYCLLIGTLLAASAEVGLAQPPGGPFSEVPPRVLPAAVPVSVPAPVPVMPPNPPTGDKDVYLVQIEGLGKEQAGLQAGAQQDDKKRIDLLIKQNETLESP